MATTSPWLLIHAEREALIAHLADLSGAGLDTLKSRSQE
jgi:hypothetical protein